MSILSRPAENVKSITDVTNAREYNAWLRYVEGLREVIKANGRRNEALYRLHAVIFGRAYDHDDPAGSGDRAAADKAFRSPEKWPPHSREAFEAIFVELAEVRPEPAPPAPAPTDTADEVRIKAWWDSAASASAVASGHASVLPTVDGRGLTPAERSIVSAAVHRATLAAGAPLGGPFHQVTPDARQTAVVAGRAALAVVLSMRPTAEPDPCSCHSDPVPHAYCERVRAEADRPSPEDRSFWARESARFDREDADWLKTNAPALDALCDVLPVPSDRPTRGPARSPKLAMSPVTDYDRSLTGAC